MLIYLIILNKMLVLTACLLFVVFALMQCYQTRENEVCTMLACTIPMTTKRTRWVLVCWFFVFLFFCFIYKHFGWCIGLCLISSVALFFFLCGMQGFSDFMQEMVSLMAESRREANSYTMEDLQAIFMEMVKGFESPPSSFFCGQPAAFEQSGCSKRTRLESNSWIGRDSGAGSSLHVPNLGMYGEGFFSF